ncbi:hypothetical protein HZB04_00235 [Candidatus Wolfebacteria bacterium]|nr:hypothetical protein [Candidatus Wolfebacteria bacterium]
MITAKSIFHSNVAFLFEEANFLAPENEKFMALYSGEEGKGARFFEDPILKAKVLILPQIKLKITIENRRLRIDDESQKEPKDSRLAKDAFEIFRKLFPWSALESFGFNFDIHFRFNNVLNSQHMFENVFGKEILKNFDLKDFGFQFTLDKSEKNFADLWFLKIVAPLELATHINRHFSLKTLPPLERLIEMFENCYDETDEVIEKIEI